MKYNWEFLKETCNFKFDGISNSRKVLTFESKLSMYEFWAGITAKLLTEVKILDLKLKEFVSSGKPERNIQIDKDEDEMERTEQIRQVQKTARMKEAEASCIKVNLTNEPREVGDGSIEEKSKKRKGNFEESEGILKTGKVIQDEILEKKAMEIEMKTLKLETDKLKVDLKAASTRLEVLGVEVKKKSETIASLEERLVLERKAVINQEMERKIQDEIA